MMHGRELTAERPLGPPMIVVNELIKTYPTRKGLLNNRGRGTRRVAINRITFSVREGELLGLLGANGSGKTSLLHALAALAYWDSGTIAIDGVDSRSHPRAIRSMVGLSTVNGNFYGRLTVRQNLRFFGTLYGFYGKRLDRRIDDVLAIVDLSGRIDDRYGTLSTGMRQRLTVARALLPDPKVLLLDEPTRAVDPVNAQALRHFIRHSLIGELGKTVILATNLLDEAWELCDRVAILRDGQITAIAAPHLLTSSTQSNGRFRISVDCVPETLGSELRALPGLLDLTIRKAETDWRIDLELAPLPHALTAVLKALGGSGVDVRDITAEKTSPSAVFAAYALPDR
jgi:ABC-type multidrug transport system ATPase subunit